MRAERRKFFGRAFFGGLAVLRDVWGTALDLVLLLTLPIIYLAASFALLDLPMRWLSGRESATWLGIAEVAVALIVALVGLARVLQDAQPLAPVRPRFAKAMFGLGWVAAVLLTAGDLIS